MENITNFGRGLAGISINWVKKANLSLPTIMVGKQDQSFTCTYLGDNWSNFGMVCLLWKVIYCSVLPQQESEGQITKMEGENISSIF